MSRFFSFFPSIDYKFGDEPDNTLVQNLSLYSNVIDQIKDETSTYQDYTIIENMRPDIVSFNLYQTPDYHWTFYLLNNKLREQGWPISHSNLLEKAKKDYPNQIITTRSSLAGTGNFLVGDTIQGRSSGATAKIIHRHLDLGQLVVNNVTSSFITGELLQTTRSTTSLITLTSIGLEFNSAHHYENADQEYEDIDPLVGPGASLTEITYLNRLESANNTLKQIRILKPSVITQVVDAFREAIKV